MAPLKIQSCTAGFPASRHLYLSKMQLIPLRPAVVLPVSWVQYSMGATKGKSGGGGS